MEAEVVAIEYYNLQFYLFLSSELDKMKSVYLAERIDVGEQMVMRDIYKWCRGQPLTGRSLFIERSFL